MKTSHHQITHVLAELRGAIPDAVHIFTAGGCFRLHLILRAIWPEAEPWYDGDHVITKIGNHWYDITGEVLPQRHLPLTREPAILRDAFSWAPQAAGPGLASPCTKGEQ